MNGDTASFAALADAASALQSGTLADLTFAKPWLLLTLIPVVFVGFSLWSQARVRPLLLFSRAAAVAALPRGANFVFVAFARFSFLATALCLALAMARPQILGEPDPITTEGIDIVVALDVSGSMRAVDFKPQDRLFVAKKVIADYLFPRKNDRIGLVVFSGEAYTQAPLTTDKDLLANILGGVRTGVIADGTAIGDGTATSVNRLRDSKAQSRVIILITDGDNNAGNIAPMKAAELAKEFGVQIYPILVGRGGRVPYPDGVDIFGTPRYTYMEWPINPQLLDDMAKMTGGTSFSATDTASLESSFKKILESLDKSRLDAGAPLRRPIDLYPLLLLPAALLLGLGLAVSMTRASTLP